MQCQHCAEPACLSACPTGATQQREDGIVFVDTDLCVGCESCIKACPYEGVRSLISDNPEYYLEVEVGEFDAPPHTPGTVEKCTFCKNLIDRGGAGLYAVVPRACPLLGDLDDPDSAVSKAIEGRDFHLMMESAGTSPNVYYLK